MHMFYPCYAPSMIRLELDFYLYYGWSHSLKGRRPKEYSTCTIIIFYACRYVFSCPVVIYNGICFGVSFVVMVLPVDNLTSQFHACSYPNCEHTFIVHACWHDDIS